MTDIDSQIDVTAVLDALRVRRPVFHSEADFQFEFAWTVRELYPNAKVRLEWPTMFNRQRASLDLLVKLDRKTVFFELKYKTRSADLRHDGEAFFLRAHGAQDNGQYDSLKDIQRLEEFVEREPDSIGVAIILTNDPVYWSNVRRVTNLDANFKLTEGRLVFGAIAWPDHAADGSKTGRSEPINLRGKYTLKWSDYESSFGFRALVVIVEREHSV